MCVCLFICMMKTETHTGERERDERGSCFVQFKFVTPHN